MADNLWNKKNMLENCTRHNLPESQHDFRDIWVDAVELFEAARGLRHLVFGQRNLPEAKRRQPKGAKADKLTISRLSGHKSKFTKAS